MPTIRLKDATRALSAVGIVLQKTKGEYRVNIDPAGDMFADVEE